MLRKLYFSAEADKQLSQIESNPALDGVLKQVRKTLGYLETNPRAKSLQTHKHESLSRRYGREVFEAYVQQDTPGAYRVFWYYGDDEIVGKGKRIPVITIIAITAHP
ncbi:MAG: hypothetical protein PHO26_08245 [Dehalococcoidia bacterium]|nr:hypothetical protein [Dehalococcoidia bacterium]MDD5494562.1 hypothetical protein [Dehalococcoidia bacterium]